jgi:hypothetical protein
MKDVTEELGCKGKRKKSISRMTPVGIITDHR